LTAEWSNIKIVGIKEMYIRPGANGKYIITFLKEITAKNEYIFRSILLNHSSSEPIQILFDRPDDNGRIGRILSVMDETERRCKD